jgi:hypothetical protein
MPLEKSFRKPQRLGPCKEQFLSLLNLFLSLFVELVHSIEKRATNSSRACSHVQHTESSTTLFFRTRVKLQNFLPNDATIGRTEISDEFAGESRDHFRVLSLERLIAFLRSMSQWFDNFDVEVSIT